MKRIRMAAVVIKNEKILLMKRFHRDKEYFTFPGGAVETGETKSDAVKREILEETTIKITVGKLLYRLILDNDTEEYFYLSKHLSGSPKLGDCNEADVMKFSDANTYKPLWYPLDALPQTLLYPLEIRDLLLEDIRNNFKNTPRRIALKLSARRQVI